MAKPSPTAARLRRVLMKRDELLIAHETTIEAHEKTIDCLRSEIEIVRREFAKSKRHGELLELELDDAQTLLARWLLGFDKTDAAKLAADTRRSLTQNTTGVTNACEAR